MQIMFVVFYDNLIRLFSQKFQETFMFYANFCV